MELSDYFPIWDKLTPEEQRTLTGSVTERSASAGTVLHNGSADCVGLLAVKSGRLRAYILSDEGKEVSLYRLFERDICLFSASCMMPSIQFDVIIEAEKDSGLLVIPAEVYKSYVSEPAVMSYAFNVSDEKEAAAEDFLKDYCDNVEPLMNYSSKATTKLSFAGMQNTVLMVGGALGVIIGIIGVLNFVNAVLTGIISRRKEFAMLQSIGMTRSQLKKMLCFEGLYYAVLSGGFSLGLGLLLSAVVVKAVCGALWFMSYRMVVWPLLAAVPVLLLLGLLIPLVIYSASDKESIVERLREAE